MRIFTNIHNPQIVDMDINPISIGADMPQPIDNYLNALEIEIFSEIFYQFFFINI